MEVAVPASAVVVAWAVAVDLGASEYSPDGAMHISMGDLIGGFTSVKGRDRLVEHSLGRG